MTKPGIESKPTVAVADARPLISLYKTNFVCLILYYLHSNIAEALVSKGLVKVVRHRQDDDSRSAHYDDLLAAEQR